MADRLCGGKLARELRRMSKAGKSTRAISNELYRCHGIEVTHGTVSNWLTVLNRPQPGSPAEAAS